MSEPACTCDGPGGCPRYGPTRGFEHRLCAGAGCAPELSQAFRDHRAATRGGQAVPLRAVRAAQGKPARIPVGLRAVCAHQGAEVPGCKSCGGPGAVVYYCDSPDDDADRCVRGRSRDKTVRSCLTCPYWSVTSNDATTGTPDTVR